VARAQSSQSDGRRNRLLRCQVWNVLLTIAARGADFSSIR